MFGTMGAWDWIRFIYVDFDYAIHPSKGAMNCGCKFLACDVCLVNLRLCFEIAVDQLSCVNLHEFYVSVLLGSIYLTFPYFSS